ncbi:hypothetical protein P4O66_004219 [Electrophorus voltai]|uniref:Uncharacterized protein n=1 Tax=Electrophorus voltai TaxID=2609070 RepID=A0AAD9E333_9TELE|nr:hypothetical protein P4O66_004219 [Electrophorus voltai]
MDYQEGYAEHGESREYSEVSFRPDSEFDPVGDPLMELEEVLHNDPPSVMDTASADSKSDEPLAPKAPPRVLRSGASKLPHLNHREAVSSSHQDTPSPKEHSPRARVSMPRPCRGKREASPVPTAETGKTVGAPPGQFSPKPREPLPPNPSRGGLPQASQTSTQPTTGGQAGVPAGFPRPNQYLLCSFVHIPVPVRVPVPVTLSIRITLSPFVSVPVHPRYGAYTWHHLDVDQLYSKSVTRLLPPRVTPAQGLVLSEDWKGPPKAPKGEFLCGTPREVGEKRTRASRHRERTGLPREKQRLTFSFLWRGLPGWRFLAHLVLGGHQAVSVLCLCVCMKTECPSVSEATFN